jgi:16S rRNA processing protein RimM
VIVNPETDVPEQRFAEGRVLIVDQGGHVVERRVVSVRFQQGRPVIALAGIDTMDAAGALAGADLKMRAADVAPLGPDTYYRHDLVGCDVADTRGRAIGRVSGVEGPKERSLLVVAGPRGEAMIPMVDGIIVRVDPAARLIVVDPPEGLLEL